MKHIYILSIALFFITNFSYADKKDKDNKAPVVVVKKEGATEYSYENVVKVDSVSVEEMYSRARKYILSNFKSSDNNTSFDDKNFSIITTGNVILEPAGGIINGVINFKLNLEFREGRYRFAFNNIIVVAAFSDGITETLEYHNAQRDNKPARHIRNQVNEKLLAISTQLEQSINLKGNTKNDW